MTQLESDTYRREKAERRRTERVRREAFRQLLREKWQERRLTVKTKWRDFARAVVEDERYYGMVGQPGSSPQELFEDFVEEQKERVKAQKATVK